MAETGQPRRTIAVGQTALTFGTAEETVAIGRGFAASVNGLVIEGEPEIEKFEAPGRKLRVMEKGAQFAIGDWANELETRFGELASQYIDAEAGWNLKTLAVYRWMSSRIALGDRRMDRLGVMHHLLVAPLTPAKQREWLTKAANDGSDEGPWTAARLKKAIADGGDAPVESWWVVVGPLASGQVQDELMARLEAEGLGVKASQRRRKLAAAPEPGA